MHKFLEIFVENTLKDSHWDTSKICNQQDFVDILIPNSTFIYSTFK